MKNLLLSVVVLFSALTSFSQSVEWNKSYTSNGGDVAPYDAAVHTNDDVFIIGGFRRSTDFGNGYTLVPNSTNGTGNSDGFLLKLDRFGNTKWAKKIATDVNPGDALHVTVKGNSLYIASQDANSSYDDYVLMEKYDTSGTRIWSKTIVNTDHHWVMDMYVDDAENTYLLYKQWQYTYVRKYDSNGNVLYTRTVGSAYTYEPEDIVADADGNFYITGATSPASYNRGLIVAKFRPDGTNVFNYIYGGTGNQETYGMKIAIDDTANFYIAGWFNKSVNIGGATITSPNTYQRAFIAKFDSTGVTKWAKMVDDNAGVHTSAGTGYSAIDIRISNDKQQVHFLYGNKFRRFDMAGTLLTTTAMVAERYFGFSEASDGSIYLAGESAYTTGYATKIGCGVPSINLPSTIDTVVGSTLNLTVAGAGYTVNWYDANGNLLAGNTPNFSLTVNGDTTIRVDVAGSGGCLASKTITINGLCYVTRNNTQTICEGTSYQGYTLPGTYRDTVTGVAGCDTIKILQLTVLDTVHTTVQATICAGQSLGGHTTSGTFTDVLTGANGCDSVRTLVLTVLPNAAHTINQTICFGDSYLGYTATGTYRDTLTAANGCDSVRTLNLTVRAQNTATISRTICQGDSYEGYTVTGTYRDTVTGQFGCDSIRTLVLTVLPNAAHTINQTICFGDNYLGYTATGTYRDTLTAANGCDSVRTLNLTVRAQNTATISRTICQGDSYEGYTATGTYTNTFADQYGCDSVRTLNLTVTNTIVTTIDTTVCFGGSYLGYTVTGSYADTFSSVAGCDSIRTLNLTVRPQSTATISRTICQGDNYEGYTTSGTYTNTFTDQYGCDSIRTLNLNVVGIITTTIDTAICAGASFEGYDAAGTYSDTYASIGGCDSVRTLILTVNALPIVSLGADTTICQDSTVTLTAGNGFSSYLWGGGETTESITAGGGVYAVTVTDANGCQALDTVEILTTVCVGINEVDMASLAVYPNPFENHIYISHNGETEARYTLVDLLGKTVLQGEAASGTTLIKLEALPSGTYLLKVQLGAGECIFKLFH